MRVAAVILAAGFGSRMKSYTEKMPKPMLPINGKPILEYQIRQLVACGINEIGINLHFFPEMIQGYFEDGRKLSCQLNYVQEEKPTGTAGGIKALESYLINFDHFLLIYGDIFTDFDFRELVSFHLRHGKLASVCVHKRSKSNSIVEIDNSGLVKSFIERPNEAQLTEQKNDFWVNSAIYAFKKEILNQIPTAPHEITDIPRDIFPGLIQDHQLMAYPISANRIAIDDEVRYLQAQSTYQKFNFLFSRTGMQKST